MQESVGVWETEQDCCPATDDAGVCGDPWQHYATSYATMSNLQIQATYTSGQIIDVELIIAANHGGRIGL